MPCLITYSFDCNKPSRYGMQFRFADTTREPEPETEHRGPVYNGRTPGWHIVAADSTQALAFLRGHIGSTWREWQLWYVMPDNHEPAHYALLPRAMPRYKNKLKGHPAQLICGITPDGEYDARVDL